MKLHTPRRKKERVRKERGRENKREKGEVIEDNTADYVTMKWRETMLRDMNSIEEEVMHMQQEEQQEEEFTWPDMEALVKVADRILVQRLVARATKIRTIGFKQWLLTQSQDYYRKWVKADAAKGED